MIKRLLEWLCPSRKRERRISENIDLLTAHHVRMMEQETERYVRLLRAAKSGLER